MARVAGVNIPDKKQAWISLTHIFGIGRTTALKICETTGIKFDTKISALNEQELEKLRKEVGNFLVEGDLRRRGKYQHQKINGSWHSKRHKA